MGHLFIYILKSIITLAAAKDFFRYYEKLNFVSHQEFLRVRHNIWQKQNPLHSTDKLTTAWIRMQGQKSIQVFLKAFETEWNIFARYDEDFCNDDAVVETHSPTGNIITRNFQDLGIVAFKGIVRNSPSTPKFVGTVKGSVQGGIFQGHIALYNDSLYIEPAKKFCIENCWYNAIIYRASDVMFSNFLVRRCQGHGEIGCVQDYMENEVYAPKKDMGLSNSSSNNNGFETDLQTVFTDPNRPRTCMVWSVADDLFAKAYGGTSGAVQQMKVYLEAADHIYRETDFNRDNRPDQVGMKAIRYKVYEKANHPMAKEGQASERILSTFASLVTKDYCLGILFTRNRWTPSGRIGLAYTAEAYSKTRIGGMCASNLNALIVTEMDSQYQILPDLVNALTTAHEFGHSFGTRHDSMSNPQCFPGKYSPDGNYIMSPTADDGHRENNVKFSTCSLDQINPVIQANGHCLVEGTVNEEPSPHHPTTARQTPGRPHRSSTTPRAPHRPYRPIRPQGKPCYIRRPNVGSITFLKTCACKGDDETCELCCRHQGHCVKSSSIGLLDEDNQKLKAPVGTPCKAGYVCSLKGKCITSGSESVIRDTDHEGDSASVGLTGAKRWIAENWVYFTMGVLCVLVVVGIAISQTRYNNQRRKAKEFSKSLSKASKKVNKHFSEHKLDKTTMNRDTLSRLKVLFPKAPLSLLKTTAEQHKNEDAAVRYLVKKGYSLKKL